MNDNLTKEQINGILAALDDALAQGPWSASTFLTIIGKKLQQIRDEFEQKQQEGEQFETTTQTVTWAGNSSQNASEMKKIYISLYTYDGSNIHTWEHIIANLPDHILSRPIYENEDDVIAILRNKGNSVNEAYVSFYIDPKSILEPLSEKVAVDKLGKPLLSLKAKALNLVNVDIFVHQSGTYKLIGGRLVKQ